MPVQSIVPNIGHTLIVGQKYRIEFGYQLYSVKLLRLWYQKGRWLVKFRLGWFGADIIREAAQFIEYMIDKPPVLENTGDKTE